MCAAHTQHCLRVYLRCANEITTSKTNTNQNKQLTRLFTVTHIFRVLLWIRAKRLNTLCVFFFQICLYLKYFFYKFSSSFGAYFAGMIFIRWNVHLKSKINIFSFNFCLFQIISLNWTKTQINLCWTIVQAPPWTEIHSPFIWHKTNLKCSQ